MAIFILFLSLFASAAAAVSIPQNAVALQLEERLIADLRLLANGSLTPLEGFMDQVDYESVLDRGRLSNGNLFPLPIVLPADPQIAEKCLETGSLILKDDQNQLLAWCAVDSIYDPDLEKECLSAFGTLDTNHPAVKGVMGRTGKKYISGKIHPLPNLTEMDREEGVVTPAEMKAYFQSQKWETIVAFQTRNPLHRAHVALIEQSLTKAGPNAALFLQPVIGPTQDEDVSPTARMKCYQATLPYFGNRPLHLGYLPLAMRMAGPKEALLHAIIRKNYGATHFIIGRDHAGPSVKDRNGMTFYEPYAAQELVKAHANELGLQIITSEEMVWVKERETFVPENQLTREQTPVRLSGSEIRRRLKSNIELPSWFSFPEVEQILRAYYQKKSGLCIYLTGLPCSGKSTIARNLKRQMESVDSLQREVVILDGDVVRKSLSADLGFSKKDRSIHVKRMGYLASLIVESGGVCICANIAPYEEDRLANREIIQSKGQYFEVFVDTPLAICELRDVKGLYKLARENKIKEFTGISDPYEIPAHPEMIVNTENSLPFCIEQIISRLKEIYPLYRT